MRENAQAEFRQGYNAQATADADGSQRILGQGVTRGANDKGELAHGAASIPAEPGRPAAVLADNGYASEAEAAKAEATGVEACVATGAEGRRRQRDFRPETGKEPQSPQKDWLRDMAGKLATDEGRDPFQLRERTAEPVFGIVKSVPGFRSFSLRGSRRREASGVPSPWRATASGCTSCNWRKPPDRACFVPTPAGRPRKRPRKAPRGPVRAFRPRKPAREGNAGSARNRRLERIRPRQRGFRRCLRPLSPTDC